MSPVSVDLLEETSTAGSLSRKEQDIGWAESCKEVSFNTEGEEYLKKAREAGEREECLLRRKPPQPSGETKGR